MALARVSIKIRTSIKKKRVPFICRWLGEKKGEELALNTLRKYVIRKIGRAEYDKYLTRNGWLKQRRHGLTPTPSAKPAEVQKPGGLGFSMDITKPRTLTRTNR